MDIEQVGKEIVDSAIKVHRVLGPGLLESAYQQCLAHELRKRRLRVECEKALSVVYEDCSIDVGLRADMLVEGMVIIENKAVDRLLPIHQAQLITYLKLSGCKIGYLLNWNVSLMKNGIRRVVYGL